MLQRRRRENQDEGTSVGFSGLPGIWYNGNHVCSSHIYPGKVWACNSPGCGMRLDVVSGMPNIRIKMCIQYDGTRYSGFQRQKDCLTVQGVLEESLERLLGHPVTIRAAGRTDAGVHARGQEVAFDTTASIPPARIPMALRAFLPEDLIASSATAVPPDFDPVKDAVNKTYCYRIWRLEGLSVLAHRYVFWYPGNLDFELMSKEALEFEGTKDFANFRAQGSSARTTVRQVFEARWARKDEMCIRDRPYLYEGYVVRGNCFV